MELMSVGSLSSAAEQASSKRWCSLTSSTPAQIEPRASNANPHLRQTPTSFLCESIGCSSTSFTTGLISHVFTRFSTANTEKLHTPRDFTLPLDTSASICFHASSRVTDWSICMGHSIENKSSDSSPSFDSTASQLCSTFPHSSHANTADMNKVSRGLDEDAIALFANSKSSLSLDDPHLMCLTHSYFKHLLAFFGTQPNIGNRYPFAPPPSATDSCSTLGSNLDSSGVFK
mmetsp:Transcript_6077/g.17890  ORF Transcript_6077/g.17890 Transcript_6077/m.17890 type:complete len:231 (-) Transcript_6077:643-1335(-)